MVGASGNAPLSSGYQPDALTFELRADLEFWRGRRVPPPRSPRWQRGVLLLDYSPMKFGWGGRGRTFTRRFKVCCATITLRPNGAEVRNRTAYPKGTSFTDSLRSHSEASARILVDRRRIELPHRPCKGQSPPWYIPARGRGGRFVKPPTIPRKEGCSTTLNYPAMMVERFGGGTESRAPISTLRT